mmetsp:Transcript_819/g.2515  ORF Transcript_819/g.2515 Transcript_819/m.2515 type:complete len:269 (-) Transcript_819:834-1640(-)|eukprot:scaffold10099_cov137-Isochrysis_galbana.AAC.2
MPQWAQGSGGGRRGGGFRGGWWLVARWRPQVGGGPHTLAAGTNERRVFSHHSGGQAALSVSESSGSARMAAAATSDASRDEIRITILGRTCCAAGMATSVRRRHMVKPMPPKMPTMARCSLDIPAGREARLSLAASSEKAKMPTGLPSSSPAPMPSAGATEAAEAALAAAVAATEALAAGMAPRGTAVLARAKRGMMKKVDRGDSRSTARWLTSSRRPSLCAYCARVEMQNAANTPAMSALTPERSKQYQSAAPPVAKTRRSEASVRP